MSESSSVADTGISDVSVGAPSDVTDSTIPLVLVSAYQDEQQRHTARTLPHLPSHRFRFSVWHDLSSTELHGSELRAPRVRDGPPIKNEMFYKLRDENNRRIHHEKQGRERRDHQSHTEDWEQAVSVNLSYQELGHQYQRDSFMTVLKRLQKAEKLNLMHDGLEDVSSVTLPECRILNLSQNYLKSFKKLPKLPKVEHLNLEDNNLETVKGLEVLARSPIVSLCVRRNPLAFTLNCRQSIFSKLPSLRVLDGLPKTPEDEVFDEVPPQDRTSCVLS